MSDRVIACEDRTFRRKRIHERRVRIANHILIALVFVDDDDNVRWRARRAYCMPGWHLRVR